MENQDLDLIGQTAGNMPYKIGIVDEKGNLKNQFVAKASTNRIDIPQSSLGAGSGVPQLPANTIIFSGSASGNMLLSSVTPNYDNVGDGILLTLSNQALQTGLAYLRRVDLSLLGLTRIKIPKEQLIAGNSIDISNLLSQYIGKKVHYQELNDQGTWFNRTDSHHDGTPDTKIVSFRGTTVNVLPNTALSMNLTINLQQDSYTISGGDTMKGETYNGLPIPVIRVNTYKN